ncbi:hypothetical protein RYX36_029858 [Vicia faba]
MRTFLIFIFSVIFLFTTLFAQTTSVDRAQKLSFNFKISNLSKETTLNSPELCFKAHLFCSSYEEVGPLGGYQRFRQYRSEDKSKEVGPLGGYQRFRQYRSEEKSKEVGPLGGYQRFRQYRSEDKFVEPGVFFREKSLKRGTVMLIPDITDKLPPREFLPSSIFSPAASSKVQQVFNVFKNNPKMKKMMRMAMNDCESPASEGEVKKCVVTVEDMVEFVKSVLGENISVKTTANVNGSGKNILLDRVELITSGSVVSCHQSLFPSIMYQCHHVPTVRLYKSQMLDLASKTVINTGIAICHVNTTAWAPTHSAFHLLGPGPGKIEVCHWIYENDLAWIVG